MWPAGWKSAISTGTTAANFCGLLCAQVWYFRVWYFSVVRIFGLLSISALNACAGTVTVISAPKGLHECIDERNKRLVQMGSLQLAMVQQLKDF
jgi:hypothetical protein